MKVIPFLRLQGPAVVTVAGASALAGYGWRLAAPSVFSAWDAWFFAGGTTAGFCAWLALRTSRRLREELEKRARALEISEERHRLLLEQASDAILVFDADTGVVIEANRHANEVLGWERHELLGQRHTVLYTKTGRETMRLAFAEQSRVGGIQEEECLMQHRDGREIPMQVRFTLVTAGSRRYIQAIMRDLRPRLEAEDALRRSEARLREVFERAPVAILEEDFTEIGAWLQTLRDAGVTDLAGLLRRKPELLAEQFARVKITGANPAALRAAGAADIETYVRKSLGAPTADVLRAFQMELEAIWQGRTAVACELSFRRADGGTGHSVMHWSVLKVDGCMDLRRVVVVFSDLSELRATEERLRLVEGRWELAVRALNVGIFEKNYATGAVFYSDRWKEMLGYAPGELPEGGDEWQARIHPEDRPRVVAHLQSHLRGEDDHYRVEYRMRCKDGQYKWVVARGRAFFDAAGKPQLLIGAHTDITERKKSEAALRASEVRYRDLFERTPVAILEEDFSGVGNWLARHGVKTPRDLAELVAREPLALRDAYREIRLRAANRHAQTYLSEVALGELVPRGDLNPPTGVLHALREELVAILEGRDEVNIEVSFSDVNGRLHHQAVRWSAARAEDGELDLSRVLVVLIDITHRKEAEAALRESEARFRNLFEHSPVAIVEQDYSRVLEWMQELRAKGVEDLGMYLDANPAEQAKAMDYVTVVNLNQETVRMAGASTKEELLENLPRVFTADIFRSRHEAFLAVWQGRNEIEGEITLRTLRGEEKRVYFRWWLPYLAGWQDSESTQLVLVDLTDIRTTEAALAAERERLRVTLRAMAEGLLTTDNEGVVQFMNESAERLTGWSSGTAIGRGVEQICVLRHERTRANISIPVARAVSEHRVVDFPVHASLVHRQGGSCVVDGRCAPMYDLAGRPIGAVVVFRDVTERVRLESELLRSSKLESVGILAGGIAHDFNNILTVVMGNVTLAMLDSQVMASAGKWLSEAERGVLRARDLTQQLLTFAKGGEPVRKAVQLPEVVRETAEFALHGSNVRCEFRFERDLWAADVDKGQIGQVVQNLVINAVQAMPEGGAVEIEIKNEEIAAEPPRPLKPGHYLRLSFTDTGVGIRPEHLPRIFDPYFTTKKSGSGLGLATVYSIIRRHQGHVDVESELGRGTVFRIWLPAIHAVQPVPVEEPVQLSQMSGRVLFMDDEETIRTIAQTLLKHLGFEVVTVSDGADAVDAYAEAQAAGKPFRLVIMDLTVPGGMGGREAMDALLKIDRGVRAIVSSGYSSDPVLANHRAHGFRGVVPKPYKLSDLARVIQGVLGEKA